MTTRYLVIAALVFISQGNQAPVVKIQSPAAGTTVSANTPVRYEVSVADKEDGDSRYDEINPKEVVLEIRRTAATNPTAASPGTASPAATSPSTANPAGPKDAAAGAGPLASPGLALMARSNCFNCHQFNGRLIGPSLADIARRYPNTAATTDTLTKRIKDGSAGIWGKEKMPSHPEISPDDIRSMVQWIEKYAASRGVTYQNGISGILQFPGVASPGSPARPGSSATPGSSAAPGSPPTPGSPATAGSSPAPGVYTIKAAYTDHGAKDTKTGPYLTGVDQLTLTVK